MEQKVGIVVALAVFAVVGLLLYINLQPRDRQLGAQPNAVPVRRDDAPRGGNPLAGIETPIGEEVERNGMLIAAAWLPPIEMEGIELPQHPHVIHLEADIHALQGNPNGFGLGAWIPYLTVLYEIRPLDDSRPTLKGELQPMVAKDGPHYGATIEMPGPGKYKLVYSIDNPSKKNFGRHSDPVTGVAEWWQEFVVEYDFDYQPKSRAADSDPPSLN